MLRLLATVMVLFVTVSPASSWSGPGHQAIAEAAQGHLNDRAKVALAAILFETDTLPLGALASVATWPDDIRGGPPDFWSQRDRREAGRFNRDHPTNGDWHFVNLPLGSANYPTRVPDDDDPMSEFVRDDDIVHAINRAILVLETAEAQQKFTKKQAVRWLVHLVGDIHQPCHTTAGYYDTRLPSFRANPVRIDTPAEASRDGVLADRGGNGLKFEDAKLHGTWDSCLANVAVLKPPYSTQRMMAACNSKAREYSPLARALSDRWTAQVEVAYLTPGDHHEWAAAWATESLRQAVKAGVYNVKLTEGEIDLGHDGHSPSVTAKITSPSRTAYVRDRDAAAREQLLKATVRLATLLNAIRWP